MPDKFVRWLSRYREGANQVFGCDDDLTVLKLLLVLVDEKVDMGIDSFDFPELRLGRGRQRSTLSASTDQSVQSMRYPARGSTTSKGSQ